MDKVRQLKSTVFVHDGQSVKGIGGACKLTQKAILHIQGHYGAAIRNNAGDVHAMKKAVWVIWKHRSGAHSDFTVIPCQFTQWMKPHPTNFAEI